MAIKLSLKYFCIVLACVLISCRENIHKKESLDNIIHISNDSLKTTEVKKRIIDFYLSIYKKNISSLEKEKFFKKIITEELNNQIFKLRSSDNLILNYDPFIKSQDYDEEVLKSTLNVELHSLERSEYKVSFNLFELDKEKPTVIILYVEDKKGGLIGGINNDKYLNYSVFKCEKELTNSRKVFDKKERLKSFVKSCGGGCVLTYDEIKISIISDNTFKTKLKVLMYIDEEVLEEKILDFVIKCDKNKVTSVYKNGKNVNLSSKEQNKTKLREYFNQVCSCSKE